MDDANTNHLRSFLKNPRAQQSTSAPVGQIPNARTQKFTTAQRILHFMLPHRDGVKPFFTITVAVGLGNSGVVSMAARRHCGKPPEIARRIGTAARRHKDFAGIVPSQEWVIFRALQLRMTAL